MDDATKLAQTARAHLANALDAIQTEPALIDPLMGIAESIAATMGLLHRIEKSGGTALDGSAEALGNVRHALDELQGIAIDHPAVQLVLDEVAGSLTKVHALSKIESTPPSAKPHPPSLPRQAPPEVPYLASPSASDARPRATDTRFPDLPLDTAPTGTPIIETAAPSWPGQGRSPLSATGESSTLPWFEIDLAPQSPSNFYRGMAGSDIVMHGGLFVATYQVPPIGSEVHLRVRLPGPAEFLARGVVQWTREPQVGGAPDSFGFGARLVDLTEGASAWIASYARHREPIFYDDL